MSVLWKDVVGYEGRYQVSTDGQVRNMNWRSPGRVRNLTPCRDKDGYLQVCLSDGNGHQKSYRVHRLVFKAFKRVAFYRLVRTILSTLTNALKEGLQNIYQYSKETGTSFADTMDGLSTSMLQLKNSLGSMAAAFISAFSPMLEWLIDLAIDLSNTIGLAVAKMSGASEWTKAVKVQNEYAAAVEKTKRSLTGFDEINVLNKQNENPDYSVMFETVSMSEIEDEAESARQSLHGILSVITAIASATSTIRFTKLLSDMKILDGKLPTSITP